MLGVDGLDLERTALGDMVHRRPKALVMMFSGARAVLSTSPLNGGYREDLTAVFNFDEKPEGGTYCALKAPTYEAHLRLAATGLELDPGRVSGLSTAASMENAAMTVETAQGLSVTAIVTAGVEVNGSRAGDPAAYDESRLGLRFAPGTINIILAINACLPQFALARAAITGAEAKAAALQELMAGSNYSSGIATGSGTDGMILVSDPAAGLRLTDAGTHSKLGELIGRAVKRGVTEALRRETGLSPAGQHSMVRRFKRYGLTEEFLWQEYQRLLKEQPGCARCSKPLFLKRLQRIDCLDPLVTASAVYIHLLDERQWGLLSRSESEAAALAVLERIGRDLGLEWPLFPGDQTSNHPERLLVKTFARFIIGYIMNGTD